MSYIGRQNLGGAYRQLDDISSGFDGSDTTHTMQVNSQNVTVGDVNQIILSLGGVIQKPGTDFTVSGSVLTFTTAPAANTTFFAILLGSDNGGTVTPTDGSVTGDKIASDLSIATNVTITTADNTDTLSLISTDTDDNSGPNLRMYRNSASPANQDVIGQIQFEGKNDAGEDIVYNDISMKISDQTDGTEDGIIRFRNMKGGTLTQYISTNHAEICLNEDSADLDLRVESNNNEYALFVDAGNDAIGIGTSSPSPFRFHVDSNSSNNGIAKFNHSHATPEGIRIIYSAAAPDNTTTNFLECTDSSATRLQILGDGDIKNHDGTYGTISDERIKQNIVDANSQWDDIKNVRVRNYKKKDDVRQYGEDNAPVHIGLIAQELQSVSPGLVDENRPSFADVQSNSEFGTLYEDGDEIPDGKAVGDVKEEKEKVLGIKYSILYMKAIKALQEAMAKIETLEADVKTLKGE